MSGTAPMMQVMRNVVNADDLRRLARAPARAPRVLARLTASDRERTIQEFSKVRPPDQWWTIPAVVRRWNRLVTGDAGTDHYGYLAARYLAGGGRVGLSVGCGDGHRELRWARTGAFATLVGVDLTPASVQRARAAAEAEGLSDVVRFEVRDLADGPPGGVAPDVIIGEHSVHHFSPLREVLEGLHAMLAPGGLFLMDEYVGPNRQQWSAEQLRCATSMLRLLPERLRTDSDGRVRTRVGRPSRLSMRLSDPSEAIESERILPLMDEIFERVELRPYGGTLLHITLSGISHHFVDERDEEAMWWLETMMAMEDEVLAEGRLSSDFVVSVHRKPAGVEVG